MKIKMNVNSKHVEDIIYIKERIKFIGRGKLNKLAEMKQ